MNNLQIRQILIKNSINLNILQQYYNTKQLLKLNGVGERLEKKINEYFEYNVDYRITHIYNHFKHFLEEKKNDKKWQKTLKYNYLCKLNDIDNIEYLYNSFNWIINLKNISYNYSFRFFEQCLIDHIKISHIINDPMLLKSILKTTFNKIDEVALNNSWWKSKSFYRIECFILNLFEEYSKNGNVYFNENDFNYFCKDFSYKNGYEINNNIFNLVIKKLINNNILQKIKLKKEDKKCYGLKSNIKIEKYIYQYIDSMCQLNNEFEIKNNKIISYNEPEKEQYNAIMGCLKNKISIITGGPGTGKTSMVLKNICDILIRNKLNILFLAPTHAAKKKAKKEINKNYNSKQIMFTTIQHVIYKFMMDKNKEECYDQDNENNKDLLCKLDNLLELYDYIIIDEMSMVKSDDFLQVISRISDHSLILVGDPDQLPSIGMGNILNDLIKSNKCQTYKLKKNFRAEKTDIPLFLNKVNNENFNIYKFQNNYKNIYTFFGSNFLKQLEKILIEKKQNKKYNIYNPENEDDYNTIQIICPLNKTINKVISLVRKIFMGIDSKDQFVKGDIVIMKNNTQYFKNGDYAKIININNKGYELQFYEKYEKNYSQKKSLINNIELLENGNLLLTKYSDLFISSYAITVHKSQGLGFNDVITIYEDNYFISKELNYTAFSRAKDNIYLLGSQKAYTNKKNNNRKSLVKHYFNNNVKLYKNLLTKPSFNNIEEPLDIINNIKKKRKEISKKVKNSLWKKYNKNLNSKCYVCNKNITAFNFQVGHIISITNGGTDNISNLRSICGGCNLSIGIHNLEHYKNKYYLKN
jgi:exodeoxyribonuclease V alpha subunit